MSTCRRVEGGHLNWSTRRQVDMLGRPAGEGAGQGPTTPTPATSALSGAACRRSDGAVTAEAGLSTRWPTIVKDPATAVVPPNLADYERAPGRVLLGRRRAAALDGLPGGRGLNIAHEAVDRHAAGPRRDRVALRWLGRDGSAARRHLRRAGRARPTASPTCCAELGRRPRRAGLHAARPRPRAVRRRARHAQERRACSARCSRRSAPSRSASASRSATARVLVTTPDAVPAQGRAAARRAARRSSTCCSSTATPRRDAGTRRPRRRSLAAPRPASRSRRPTPRTWRCCTSPAARPARRRARSTSTRRSSPTTPPAARARSAPGRRLLVHRRSRAG